jgi:UDP-N-acetylmuramoylalanine--D-glutamate ligase
MTKAEIFFNQMKNKRIAFIGTGVTNTNIIKLFLSKDFDVTICDRKSPEQMGELYDELKNLGAKYIMGEKYLDTLTDFDVVFRSPGMYFNNPALKSAREKGVVITSEMEVFFELCPCKIYAVTGSDGKTTTTTLISEFLSKAGKTVHKGGNIGRALLPIIEEIKEDDVAVVELSSFQLISMRHSPDVAVITNIAPNHLDVHGTMEE